MSHSDDFGLDDDDNEFITAATQVEQSQHASFQTSPQPAKRRRLTSGIRGRTESSSSETLGGLPEDRNSQILAEQSLSKSNVLFSSKDSQSFDSEPEEDADYYFPGELPDADDQSKRQSKYKIHIPRNGGHFADQILTQTQAGLDTSPGQFRGPIWKRPQPPPPPVFSQKTINGNKNPIMPNSVSGHRQITLSTFTNRMGDARAHAAYQKDAALAAKLQAQENSQAQIGAVLKRSRSAVNRAGLSFVSEELADLPSDAFASSPAENRSNTDITMILSQSTASQSRTNGMRAPQQGLKQMTIFGQPATQDLSASQAANKKYAWPLKARVEPPTHHKLEPKAMETWVYPTNLGTTRDYQYNIVQRSLFHNTLVALPTGLGKTFIAATVMLNYYRWTADGQIVFMAPTKPLIAQQMEACYGIVGIPRRDTVLMTGETAPALRAEEWLEKRVFFMTPQTVINDLKTGICDPKKIVLVVVDEAHKATGGYAYTEVIKFLQRFNESFRVQALTATPGSTVEAVQAVIDNLGIARVELRTEQSLDIREYTHEKHTDTQLFDFSDEQERIMHFMSQAIRPVLEKLCTQNAYWSRDPMQLTAYGLTIARQKWGQSDAGRKAPFPVKGMVNAIFTVLASLAHAIGLLKFHGIVPFHSKCLEFQQTNGKYVEQIAQSEHFTKMMSTIRSWTSNADFIGHPKLEYLREVLLNHFLDAGETTHGSDRSSSATRVMVFASYRDSTEDICRVLKRNEPMIRPHVFVGQASSKNSEGMDQKRQNAVIQDFKSGKYNTLIATSIGEEGLDIGTVDLIVCYDASSSPIRMLQRIGRTGRKRLGNVVLLLMRGKEENDYAKAQDNYAYIQKTIADPGKYTYHDEQSPRILPKEIQPVVDKRMIDIPPENSQPIDLNEKGRKARGKGKLKRPPKKFHMPDGVRTGFVNASRLDSDGDDHADPAPAKRKKNVNAQSTKFRHAVAPPEPEPVQLPFLADVLLTNEQQDELERKYAHTTERDCDFIIRAPDALRFPNSIEQLTATKYVRHGRASLVAADVMNAMRGVDDESVERMRTIVDLTDLRDAGRAMCRLTSPGICIDGELPDDPLSGMSARKTRGGRPRKTATVHRTASITSLASTGCRAPSRTTARKSCGRPRKETSVQRVDSYGSAAAEGVESSPEPTPANMCIGTQGIELGSRDTSGEDEDDDPDSELEDFIVKSDQPIEMTSSSQQFLDDTQSSKPRRAPLRTNVPRTMAVVDSDSSDADPALAALGDDDSEAESGVEEVAPPTKPGPNVRKRRVIGDSDDDE